MRYLIRCLILQSIFFAGCNVPENSTQPLSAENQDTGIAKESEVDSLKKEIEGVTNAFQQYAEQTKSANQVYVVEMTNSQYRRLHSLYEINSLMVNYTTARSTYPAGITIHSIFPDRDTSSYQLRDNELTIKDPIEFWRLYRFCLLITFDTVHYGSSVLLLPIDKD